MAKLQLLLWFVNDNKKSIFLVAYWWFMCYNTLRRTMSNASEINRLESHLESMILMNDSKMILFFRKAQEIQGASWNIKK